jgi:tRNA-dihydrouridine synthase A
MFKTYDLFIYSPKVSARCFGARLMLDPERVRQIVATMNRCVTTSEITVKCRLGADDRDSYEELCEFVLACKAGGCKQMIMHARKCILDGMSTAKNRSVPPLHYDGSIVCMCLFPTISHTYFCIS